MKRALARGAARMARRKSDPPFERLRDAIALRRGTPRGSHLRELIAGRTAAGVNETAHAATPRERAVACRIALGAARDRLWMVRGGAHAEAYRLAGPADRS